MVFSVGPGRPTPLILSTLLLSVSDVRTGTSHRSVSPTSLHDVSVLLVGSTPLPTRSSP